MISKVFHIRLPRFLVQAERVMDPRLSSRAVGIVSSDRSNGTLVAISSEAEQEGIHPGMPVSLVQKMSPRTVLLPSNASLYHKVNNIIFDVVSSFCPVVEPSGFGQFYLDMHGMTSVYDSYRRAGELVAQSIRRKADLRSQVGISRNKLVSAITTKVVPERLYSVENGEEVNFLSPLVSRHLPISEEKPVQTTLRDLNARFVQNIQELTLSQYAREVIFGKLGNQVHRQAYGIDTSAVKPPQIRDHIVERKVLDGDTNDEDMLLAEVQLLADQVAFQLRCQSRIARKAVLSVHYTDGYESSATGSLLHHSDQAVIQEFQRLYHRANRRRNRVRAIMADVFDFRQFARQMDLFDDAVPEKDDNLSRQLDKIRSKYGFEAIIPATGLIKAA
jgi:DNA polymerase-4